MATLAPALTLTWPRIVLATATVTYLVISTSHLSTYPLVGQDESWIAAAPAKLAAEGVLGNDIFTGYYGMERHHLAQMPVYPLLEAGVFRVFGVGVWQMRALSVTFGLLLIVAVFLVGSQAGGEAVGALAVVFLMTLRITASDEGTGILLLDRARINRYDIAVPVFGLFALWVLNRAQAHEGIVRFAIAGALAGLSSLSHLYGVFWLPVLLALVLVHEGRRAFSNGSGLAVTGGFVLAWAPWIAFITTSWPDYLGQMKPEASRFDLFTPSFYVHNIVEADGPLSIDWMFRTLRELPVHRVGTWVMMAGLCAGFVVSTVAAVRRRRRTAASIALPLAASFQLVLFTSLLSVKTTAYMIALWPLGALMLACTAVAAWHAASRWPRIALLTLGLVTVAEGAGRIAHTQQAARRVSPYAFYTEQIARCIPTGSRVLGLPQYWLGLRQFEYRAWLLPIYLSRAGWYHEPLTFEDALRRVDPSIVLLDAQMSRYFEQNQGADRPYHRDAVDEARFLAERGAELVCSIQDRSYGTMLVYQLRSAGDRRISRRGR